MFQLLKDPKIDFMGKRHVMMALSGVLVLASIGLLVTRGLNRGIEFTGGTEVQIKFAEAPDLGAVRSALAGIGRTTPVVTTIGDPANHEVYIKLGAESHEAGEGDRIQAVINALRDDETKRPRETDGRIDLNVVDQGTVERLLASSGEPGDLQAVAAGVLDRRKEIAIFHAFDELSDVPGMTPALLSSLEEGAFLGPFAIRSQSFIGPVIGRELLQKAMLAIVGSLIGMLIYIWIRFQLQWGFAAVAALAHDTLITLGLFSIAGKEMSLPVVAAFLTLVGYSVNDTVVVFDRIRENIRTAGTLDLTRIVNRSLNQTLSRTVITSGSTWIVVVGLYLFGGEALSSFSFVLTVGILVGTYSSIFIASPIVVLWRGLARRTGQRAGGAKAGAA